MWNKIKFWLGLKCVVQMGDKWVITHREFGIVRSVLDSSGHSWPAGHGFLNNMKHYNTREEAEQALNKFKYNNSMKP